MQLKCTKCDAQILSEGGPHGGPKFVEFSCGSVWHQSDGEIVEHNSCLRRQICILDALVRQVSAAFKENIGDHLMTDEVLAVRACIEHTEAEAARADID